MVRVAKDGGLSKRIVRSTCPHAKRIRHLEYRLEAMEADRAWIVRVLASLAVDAEVRA